MGGVPFEINLNGTHLQMFAIVTPANMDSHERDIRPASHGLPEPSIGVLGQVTSVAHRRACYSSALSSVGQGIVGHGKYGWRGGAIQ